MFDLLKIRSKSPSRFVLMGAGVALMLSIADCNKKEPPTASQPAPQAYASPEDAGKALMEAAKSDNQQSMLAIFGPESKDLLYSGDNAEDKAALAGFVQAYDKMHRWRKLSDGSQLLLAGADNQAFPIPLKKNASGQWYFDSAAGKDEILARRIGADEIAAIDVCAAIADGQMEYFSQHHDGVKQYAQKFISDPGKQNGLYWESPVGQPRSPLGPLVAFATNEGFTIRPGTRQAFHGYFFRRLDSQGPDAKGGAKPFVVSGKMTRGFAYLAYPERYNDTGIQTFIINQDRIVYQKNLGKDTGELAMAIHDFNPDQSWTALK